MKKNSFAEQLERKIRQMDDRYRHVKKFSVENVSKQAGLVSGPQERINDIIRNDLKNHLPLIKLQSSRDVSHLKNTRSPKYPTNLTFFPTSLQQLKKFIEPESLSLEIPQSNSFKSLYSDRVCYKSFDFEEQTIELLEKIDHAFPSNRKEAENLLNWFIEMKSKYETEEDFETVILFCEQEITKQIFVDCKIRGNLMKMIFSYYHSIINKIKEKHEQIINKIHNDHEKKHEKVMKQHNENIAKLINRIKEQKNSIEKQENISKSLEEEIGFYKKKLHDMQRVYLEEQEMWKKQYMDRLRKSIRKGNVFTNDKYNLAVAKWRKDMYSVEIHDEITLPENIKEKINNGEDLDFEEIKVYQDLYYKKQEELDEKKFVEAEMQTDDLVNDDFLEYANTKVESEPNVVIHTVMIKEQPIEKEVKDQEVQTDEIYEMIYDEDVEEEEDDIFNEIKKIISPEDLQEFEEDADDYNDSFLKKLALLGMRSSPSTGRTPKSWGNGNKKLINPGFSDFVANYDGGYNEELKTVFENDEEILKGQNKELSDSDDELDMEEFKNPNDDQSEPPLSEKTEISISQLDSQNEGKDESKLFPEVKTQNPEISSKKSPKSLKGHIKKQSEPQSEKLQKNIVIKNSKGISKKRNKTPENTLKSKENDGLKGPYKRESIIKSAEGQARGFLDINDNFLKAEKSFLITQTKDKKPECLEKSSQNLTPLKKSGIFRPTHSDEEKPNGSLKGSSPKIEESQSSSPNNPPNQSLIPIPQNLRQTSSRRVSVPINLQNSAALFQDLLTGKLGKNLKNTTRTLIRGIKTKKKELAELESLIQMKRRILSPSGNSQNSSFDRSSSPKSDKPIKKRHFSTGEIFTRLVTRLNTMGDKGQNSFTEVESTEKILRQLIKEEMKNARLQTQRSNIMIGHGISLNRPISEENEEDIDDINKSHENPRKKWKRGYAVGYQRGKVKGFLSGKSLGREEGMIEGFQQAFKDMNQYDSLSEDSDNESHTQEGNSLLNLPNLKGKFRKNLIQTEAKSARELTKFAEFKFASQKAAALKPPSPASDLVKRLLKKTKDNIIKKAKSSRKIVNKLIINAYQTALSHLPIGNNDELYEISYEDFTQKYGLRKVADRKFIEFIASIIKTKSYKKSMMFLKLSGLGKNIGIECYNNATLVLYLESWQYMINSKIGIMMSYEETDDINLFPLNRAVECVKEKLEPYFDKAFIGGLLLKLEKKSIPDPQRISTALIELEFVLEIICDAYEVYLKQIYKGLNDVLKAFGYESNTMVLQYDLALAIRYICPSKFQRLESEDILTQEFSQEEAYQLCIDMSILHENEVNNFVKGYGNDLFENYSELIGILDLMEENETCWISVSEEKWRMRLNDCMKKWDKDSLYARIAWRVYESEIRRIKAEYLKE